MKVVIAFLINDGKLFVAKRSDLKKFFPGIYELPGGKVELGETNQEALKRELQEELDIIAEIGEFVGQFSYKNLEQTVEEYCYVAEITGGVIKLNPKDHSDSKWITKDEIDRYLAENPKEKSLAQKGFKILEGS